MCDAIIQNKLKVEFKAKKKKRLSVTEILDITHSKQALEKGLASTNIYKERTNNL